MNKRNIVLLLIALLLVLCSCQTVKFDISELEISVFEDYDSLISIDNSKLQIVELPVDRIIICKKGEQVYGYFTGSFSKNIAKMSLKNVDSDYEMEVVSSGLIEFRSEGTEKPETIIDPETAEKLKTEELFVITTDIQSIPLGDFEIPEVFLSAFNSITVTGTGDKADVVIDVREQSMVKTLFIVMKAGIIVNAQSAGQEIDVENISSLIEQVDNRIYLHDVYFNIEDLKSSFGSVM